MSSDKEQRQQDPNANEHMLDAEKHVKRNPHGNFKEVEAGRPDWNEHSKFEFTKTKKPEWKAGDGGNDGGESLKKDHVCSLFLPVFESFFKFNILLRSSLVSFNLSTPLIPLQPASPTSLDKLPSPHTFLPSRSK